MRKAGSRSLVTAGREQTAAVHALAHAINARLGAFGTTVRAIEPVRPLASDVGTLADLAEAIAAGQVTHLVVLGGNPVYTAPADIDLAALIRRVPLSLHLGQHRDETASVCHWHVPESHPLESWGDLRAFDGTVGLRQPVTMPLKPGLSAEELLGLMAGQNLDGQGLVRATWREVWGEGFEERWARSLEDGVVATIPHRPPSMSPSATDWKPEPAAPAPAAGLDVAVRSRSLGLGRHLCQ